MVLGRYTFTFSFDTTCAELTSSWGTFQTCTTAFASEIVPTVLRPYVTAWVCMCWGLGITISSAVVRAVADIHNDWGMSPRLPFSLLLTTGWRLPFALQWVWPIPLLIGVYLAPESPWNSVRRGKMEQAMTSLRRLGAKGEGEDDFKAKLAYIVHTTNQEKLESWVVTTRGKADGKCRRTLHRLLQGHQPPSN